MQTRALAFPAALVLFLLGCGEQQVIVGVPRDAAAEGSTGEALPVPTALAFFAGAPAGWGSADGIGGAARFRTPTGVAVDGAGTVFVADQGNHTIRRIGRDGTVTTFAGSPGLPGSGDGAGASARFQSPAGVVVDGFGNVLVADRGGHTVRKITPDGGVTTLAGIAGSPGAEDGPATLARFNGPTGVAVDRAGNVFVADQGNHTLRKITPAGAVTTLAGAAGVPGSADGSGSSARFDGPQGVAVDGTDKLVVADTLNHTIRRITAAGVVTTLAGAAGVPGSADGSGSGARFNGPTAVAVDGAGSIFVTDAGNHTVRAISPAAAVSTLAGTAGVPGGAEGTGPTARFFAPAGITVDATGNLFVADSRNHTIRTLGPSGTATTLAGFAGTVGSADGEGTAASFNTLGGVAVDGAGNVFVADSRNHTIRKITPEGVASTFAGAAGVSGSDNGRGAAARFSTPSGIAVDGASNVFVADTNNHTIRKITPAGVVTTLAGSAGAFGDTDAKGAAARFHGPLDVAVDGAGNVFVADHDNHTIRRITPASVVTTLAGNANAAGSADGKGAAARFNWPTGVAVDGSGNVYVADRANDTIRRITPAGEVSTLAGRPGVSGSVDGAGSDARFDGPSDVAADQAGNVFVADTNNNTIRMITRAGVVSTLVGFAAPTLVGNVPGPLPAALVGPIGVAVGPSSLYITVDSAVMVAR